MSKATLDNRLHLLHENVDAIMALLAKVVASGEDLASMVVVVADARDPIGGRLAQAAARLHPGLDADAEAARARALGRIPTVITLIPRKAATPLFRLSNPSVGKGLAHPPPAGHVHVVAVGAGGATLVAMPLDLPTGGGGA
jgi:hypothetical protein